MSSTRPRPFAREKRPCRSRVGPSYYVGPIKVRRRPMLGHPTFWEYEIEDPDIRMLAATLGVHRPKEGEEFADWVELIEQEARRPIGNAIQEHLLGPSATEGLKRLRVLASKTGNVKEDWAPLHLLLLRYGLSPYRPDEAGFSPWAREVLRHVREDVRAGGVLSPEQAAAWRYVHDALAKYEAEQAAAEDPNSTTSYKGELQIDHARGVVYFHLGDPEQVRKAGTVTMLRICGLPTPIPNGRPLDVSFNQGEHGRVNWIHRPKS